MSFTPAIVVSQSAGTPENITVQDTSTGSDVAIVKRRLFLLQADGTYLVPNGTTTDYIEWALATNPITENLLTQDIALEITVQWLDVSNTVLYTYTNTYGLDAFGNNFFYGLTDGQVPITNPYLELSSNYYLNKVQFYCYLTSAQQAITWAGDIYKAQIAYDLDQAMIDNSNYYF